MFLLPVIVSMLKHGWILTLYLDYDSGLASLYKAKLHNWEHSTYKKMLNQIKFSGSVVLHFCLP